MAKYKLNIHNTGVLNVADGIHIPNAPGNKDWDEYQKWLLIPGNTPDDAQTLEEVKFEKIRNIKHIASITILGSFSDVKQRNLLARTTELLLKKINTTITQPELDELTMIESIWTWIKGIRSDSNAVEILINAATDKIGVSTIAFSPIPY